MSTLALCIPVWNGEGCIARLLETARRQTRPFDEILVFDDGSTDESAAVAQRYGATVISTGVNQGPSHGKNILAAASRCDWLHFHDADDALHPEFVDRAGQWIAGDAADVVLFATEDRDEGTGTAGATRVWDDEALRRDPIAYAIATTITNCGIYRRAAFLSCGGFDTSEATKYNEDQAFHLRLAIAGLRFRADSYVGVVVYRRTGSMSSGHPIECARAQVEVLARAAQSVAPRYYPALGERLWHLAVVSATYSDWPGVRRCLSLATALGHSRPSSEPAVLRAMARVSPVGAVLAREYYVRAFKPRLRRGVPQAR